MSRLTLAVLTLALAGAAAAQPLDGGAPAATTPATPTPAATTAAPATVRVYWSFPNDDITAIEVDDADLSAEGGDRWASRVDFAQAMQHCDFRRSRRLAQHKDGTPVREIRVESQGEQKGAKPATRCVMTLKQWRKRIGKDLVYRLDDELDAHESFLLPRRGPGMPAKVKLDGGVP